MSDIILARACCSVPLYVSLIALASCSRHARPPAPASPPPATHSLCREQFCRLALCVGCLLCCCLFIRQSPAGLLLLPLPLPLPLHLPPRRTPTATPGVSYTLTLNAWVTAFSLKVSVWYHHPKTFVSSPSIFSVPAVVEKTFLNCQWRFVVSTSTIHRVLTSRLETCSASLTWLVKARAYSVRKIIQWR
jgi:hypothetical protein